MTRHLICSTLAGTLLLGLATAAQAQDVETASIVGGSSTLTGLTGLVHNPEAYTAGIETTTAGLNFIFGDDTDAWVPTLLHAIDDRFEIGAFGQFIDSDSVDDVYGASVKWKFYDERSGVNFNLKEEPEGGGFPSMAAFYTYLGSGDVDRHRVGLALSWTFIDDPGDTEGTDFNNTTFTAGAMYDLIESDSEAFAEIGDNDFDWFVGVNFNPSRAWSVVLEYEDDDDTFASDGFAGAVRWHLNPDDPEHTWTVQAGWVNEGDILVGAQASF